MSSQLSLIEPLNRHPGFSVVVGPRIALSPVLSNAKSRTACAVRVQPTGSGGKQTPVSPLPMNNRRVAALPCAGERRRAFCRDHHGAREGRQGDPLGVKGIGEVGIVGMNAAVANAVYHATGKRIRELPIRPEKLL